MPAGGHPAEYGNMNDSLEPPALVADLQEIYK